MAFDITEILKLTFGNNSVKDYLVAIVVFIVAYAVLKFFKYEIVKKLHKLAKKTKSDIDDLVIAIIDAIHWPFYVLVSLYTSLLFLEIPNLAATTLKYIMIIVLTYYVVRGIQAVLDYSIDKVVAKRKEREEDVGVIHFLKNLLKGILWVVAVLLILQNLGYNITTLIAGLGIGGLAIAFALQNILADIFASITIYFDKPFKIGDFIIIGSDMGVIKHIGIKSTRIQTLQGQELIISNRELTNTRVNNYKKMKKRRIPFTIGVTYQTSAAKLKKIPGIIKGIIDKIELADLDRVHFKQFGDFSLNYEIVYYVANRDYNTYMDIQQRINLALVDKFEKEKIEFAYPTQTIFLTK